MRGSFINEFPGELSSAELEQILVEWNKVEQFRAEDRCIHELFEEQTRHRSDAIAVIFEDARVSYAELNGRANKLAHHLRALGVQPDQPVALCFERSVEMLTSILAVLKAGGTYVPLDPAHPIERLRYTLGDSAPSVVLTHSVLAESVLAALETFGAPVLLVDSHAHLWASASEDNLDRGGLTSSNLAYIIYTSGSTGQPKGVMVEHANVVRLFEATLNWYGFGPGDVWTLFHSFAFDFSVWEIWGALIYGGTLVIVPRDVARSPRDFYELVCKRGVTVLNQTPSAFRELISAQERLERNHSLRHVIFGGEPLDFSMLSPWFERGCNVRARLTNMYGITETTVHVTHYEITAEDVGSDVASRIGSKLRDMRVYILSEDLDPVAINTPGELYVGGAGVARGYWNRPELTAERFIDNPFVQGDRLYKTGDVARFTADGTIEYIGRNDYQVKIRGFRIELGEIEAALRARADIQSAVVLAREDDHEQRLVAYYICSGVDLPPYPEMLQTHLQDRLPEYMIPAAYVALDSFPLTVNGKIDRVALPAPTAAAFASSAYEAPANLYEEELARIWSDVLRVDNVGRHDNFFALGGHSLLLIRVIEHVTNKWGVRLSALDVFGAPVLCALAQLVAQAKVEGTPGLAERFDEEIVVGPGDGEYRVSFGQEQVAILGHLVREHHSYNRAYNTSIALWLNGELDEGALRLALQRVIDEHSVLRTAFVDLDGELQQRLRGTVELPLEIVDFQEVPFPERDNEIRAFIDQATRFEFRLDEAPLLRWSLIRVAPQRYAFVQVEHHFVHDGWSMSILVDDILDAYARVIAGGSGLSKLPACTFADYVAWQRRFVESPAGIEQLDYWVERLSDVPAGSLLPTDAVRSSSKSFTGAALRHTIDSSLMRRIRASAARCNSSVYSFCLAAFAAFLARYNRNQEIVLGGSFANRRARGTERLLGMLVNMVVYRLETPHGRVFAEFVREVSESVAHAYEHQEVPFENVVRKLQPQRLAGRNPLFEIAFNFHDAYVREIAAADLTGDIEYLHNGSSKFDLNVICIPKHDGSTEVLWEYDTDLFTVSTAQRYLDEFVEMLRSVSAAPEKEVRTEALSPNVMELVLREWNATEAAFPDQCCIHELFEEQVNLAPEAIAIARLDSHITYDELNKRANQLARHLRILGVGPDALVAVCCERSAEFVVGVLAVLKSGGAYVPIDPRYPAERLSYILRDSDPAIVLTLGQLKIEARQVLRDSNAVLVDLGDDTPWCANETENLDCGDLTPANLAYVIYTSGSTGQPKGAMIEHRSVCNLAFVQGQRLDVGAHDRVFQFASYTFDASLMEWVWALTHGASLYIPPSEEMLVGESLAEVLNSSGATHVLLPPPVLLGLPSDVKFGSLRVLMVGGDASSESLVKRFGQRVRLVNAYGPTEATVYATLHECDPADFGDPPIGRPIANGRVYILDGEAEPVPLGAVGEIYIGGAGVARGYLNRPDLTAERFLASPFVEGDRLYRTGDLARFRADGTLEYLGRNDFQVKIRGFRIELGEIESMLKAHSEIEDAVVVAQDSVGEKRLIAYYTAPQGNAVTPEQLRSHLSSRLPTYMIPAAYVSLVTLPLTRSGKLDREALPIPDAPSFATRRYEAPTGDVEKTLAAIWSDLLGVDEIGRLDDFFALGGHSLLAARMIARVRQSLACEPSLNALFAHPTLSAFAHAMRSSPRIVLPPIERVVREGQQPLSFAQQRLWFLSQMEGVSEAYHIPLAVQLRGNLDSDALQNALNFVVERHDSLRTLFDVADGVPFQRVSSALDVPLLEDDLCDQVDADVRLAAIIENEVRAPFDLIRGPLLRARLIRVRRDEYYLVITMHHIVGDGWSVGVLMRELGALYGSIVQGENASLPSLSVQYTDFAAWQRHWIQGAVLTEQTEYWKRTLTGAPDILAVPTDRPRPAEQDLSGGRIGIRIDEALRDRLKMLSQKHGTTLFMTLLTAWAILLSRLSGQSDIVVGSPVANRRHPEVESLVGFFANMLALRLDCSASPTVSEMLRRVKAAVLEAQAHQDLPFEQVVEGVRPRRSLSHTPLFQAVFAWQNSGEGVLALPAIECASIDTGYDVAKFDLTLSLEDSDESVSGFLHYAASLFDESTAHRYATYFVRVVDAITSEDLPIDKLQLLSSVEREQAVAEWNTTNADYPRHLCAQQLFEEQVERLPDAVAVEYEAAQLSYADLNKRANQLARYLRRLGVGPDVRVALCFERSVSSIVAILAVLKAGGAYVPLDPAYPANRLTYMILDSAPLVVLTHGFVETATREVLAAAAALVVDLDVDERWVDNDHSNLELAGLTSAHLAYVIYTSGSTGQPKGVQIEHHSVCNLAMVLGERLKIGPGDCVFQFASYSFDASLMEWVWALAHGARLFVPTKGDALVGQELNRSVEASQSTHILLPPPVLMGLPPEARLESLRILMVGGDASTEALVKRFAPSVRLVNAYGPTEATVFATLFECDALAVGDPPIGRAISNARIYLLDEFLQPVPIGVAGELHIGGAGVARGYLDRPELTATRFIPSPFVEGDRLYKTGDLARYRPDGTIEYLGRNDFQVKVRGFRIELGDIEARMREQDEILDSVVLAREDGRSEKKLVAYYVPSGSVPLDIARFRYKLQRCLPEYMIPAAFVALDALPLLPSGKVDRAALPDPDDSAYASQSYEAPIGEVEQAVARIWGDVLGVERVGRNDDFFELGGHSLLVVRMLARVRQILGIELSLSALFAEPVLHGFACTVESSGRNILPPIAVAQRESPIPLSFSQQRLWFLSQIEGVSEAYHVPLALQLKGALNRVALRSALDRVVARHESLRTTFEVINGEPIQQIGLSGSVALAEHDLRGQQNAAEQMAEIALQEANAPFDLRVGPLIRARLIQIRDQEHVLLVTMHHIVADGWSVGIFLREVSALYSAFVRAQPDDLALPAVQYADFSCWQRRWLQGSVLQEQGSYWQKVLSGAPELIDLPLDRARPAEQDLRGGRIAVRLDGRMRTALNAVSQRHGSTLFMTLLGAWAMLLARLSGQRDIVVGTPVANRRNAEVESLIGFFANTLALRFDCSGKLRVDEFLHAVKETTLAAQAHQDIPFEQVVELVRPERTLAYTPIFQVMFAWQNAESSPLSLPEIECQFLSTSYDVAKFDLTLSLEESSDGIVGVLHYAKALFDELTARRFVEYFERILRAIADDDLQHVGRIQLLSPFERNRVLTKWNNTETPYSASSCLHELFESYAATLPESAALVLHDKKVSYSDLNARANRLARHLREVGVGPDVRVALCFQRGLEFIVAVFAVLKAGGAFVPLDPVHPPERLSFILEDSAPAVILTHSAIEDQSRNALCRSTALLIDVDHEAVWRDYSNEDLDRGVLAYSHLAYVIYTSGSTGQPKGAMIEHRSVCNLVGVQRRAFGLRSDSRVLQAASIGFDASIWEIVMALCNGASLCLAPASEFLAAGNLENWVDAFSITHMTLSPSVLNSMSSERLRTVNCLIVAGEAPSAALVHRWNTGRRLINAYGPTEATVCATTHDCDASVDRDPPIGRAIANVRVYILDEFMEPVPIGVAGELHIGGVGVARGYLNRTELTAEQFVPSPFAPDDRLYKTGDVARFLPDGALEFRGRNDFQVKINGIRIELGEIESALQSYPGIRNAVVVAQKGSNGPRLVAYYASSDHISDPGEPLRSYLTSRLPGYMIPAVFVELESLPTTVNGKINRGALPLADFPTHGTRDYAPPVGDVEVAIARIWSEVLGVELVSRHDNFFELGGHSLLLTRVIENMRRLNMHADIRTLFTASTLSQLASSIVVMEEIRL